MKSIFEYFYSFSKFRKQFQNVRRTVSEFASDACREELSQYDASAPRVHFLDNSLSFDRKRDMLCVHGIASPWVSMTRSQFLILTPNHRPFSRSPVFRLFFRRDKWITFAIFSPLIGGQVTHRCHSSGSFSSSICSCEQVWTSSRRCLHHFANIRRLVKLTKFAVYYLQCYYGWIIGNTVNSFSANLF